MLMDVHQRGNLRFPQSLPEFQRLFPDDAACAGYLEKARWSDGFVCPHCQAAGEPFRFANRPGVLRCRKCRRDTGLTVGTVMARSHTPLSVWFWSAYLVSSQTPGISAVQLRRQLGLSRGSTLHVVGVGNNRIGKEYRSDVASAAECAGLRSQGPCLAVYRRAGAREPGFQGDRGQLREWARPAAVRSAHDGRVAAARLCEWAHSSRRIARACRERNDFVMIVALDPPDFRTISDFRKRHLKALGALFLQF